MYIELVFILCRSSIEVSPCQEERETVKLADIVRTSPSSPTQESVEASGSNSTDISAESLLRHTVAAVWERRVCRAKEVETQSRYSLSERNTLVADRVGAALAGSIPPPYLYDHNNDRL